MSVWLMTGPEIGLVGALVHRLCIEGEKVVVALPPSQRSRDATSLSTERKSVIALDVDDPRDADNAVAFALSRYGSLDILINAPRIVDSANSPTGKYTLQTNPFGIVNMTRAAAHVFRQQRHGRVLNIHTAPTAHYFSSPIGFDALALGNGLRSLLTPYSTGVTVVESAIPSTPDRCWTAAAGTVHRAACSDASPSVIRVRPDEHVVSHS